MYSVTSLGTLSTLFQPERKKENMPCFFPFSTHLRKLKIEPLQRHLYDQYEKEQKQVTCLSLPRRSGKSTLYPNTHTCTNLSVAVPAFNLTAALTEESIHKTSLSGPLHIFITQPHKFCIAWTKSSVVTQSLNISVNFSNYWIPQKMWFWVDSRKRVLSTCYLFILKVFTAHYHVGPTICLSG